MFESRNPYAPWINVAAAMAAGAALAFAVDMAMRRMQRLPAPLSDEIVLERVRTRVREVVGDPDSVQVTVENGIVRLAGEVPAEERDELLTQLLYMPGVMRLRNALGTL